MYSLLQHLGKCKALLMVVARTVDFYFPPEVLVLYSLLWVLKFIVLQFRCMSHFEPSDEIILKFRF